MEHYRGLVQALINECLSTAYKGVFHDGLESDAATALLKEMAELEKSDRHLNQLKARGVDNWEGYRGLRSLDDEEDDDEE